MARSNLNTNTDRFESKGEKRRVYVLRTYDVWVNYWVELRVCMFIVEPVSEKMVFNVYVDAVMKEVNMGLERRGLKFMKEGR